MVYVDTVGSFTWAGFQAIAGALPRHAECAEAAEAHKYLSLYRVFSLHELLQLLHALGKALDQVQLRVQGEGLPLWAYSLSCVSAEGLRYPLKRSGRRCAVGGALCPCMGSLAVRA